MPHLTPSEVRKNRADRRATFLKLTERIGARMEAIACQDSGDEKALDLLEAFGLRLMAETNMIIGVTTPESRMIGLVARSDKNLLPVLPTGPIWPIPADALRLGAIRYTLTTEGQVHVDLVREGHIFQQSPLTSLRLTTLASPERLDDKRLRKDWLTLSRYAQVQWTGGCSTVRDRQRVRWMQYRKPARVEGKLVASALSQHAWSVFRWVVMVGCSGALVVVSQGLFAPTSPVSPTAAQVGQSAQAAQVQATLTALAADVHAVRQLAEAPPSPPALSIPDNKGAPRSHAPVATRAKAPLGASLTTSGKAH